VIAPDRRGCARTSGWDAAYDRDIGSFRTRNIERGQVGLVGGEGLPIVTAVVGLELGPCCALLRCDIPLGRFGEGALRGP
jgi:hypothetical protein